MIGKIALTRKRLLGRMSDGSDRTEVAEQVWAVTYLDDQGLSRVMEFNHDPTETEVEAFTPRRVSAKGAVASAVVAWSASQLAWSSATTTPQALNALHLEHVAVMKALRALAFLDRIDD